MPLALFVIASVIGRALQFFLVAGVLWWGGEQIEKALAKWTEVFGWGVVALAVGGYLLLRGAGYGKSFYCGRRCWARSAVALVACSGPSLPPVINKAPNRVIPVSAVARADDTIYSIAWRYGLDYQDIAKWNQLARPYRVRKGQAAAAARAGGEGAGAGCDQDQGEKDRASGEAADKDGRVQGGENHENHESRKSKTAKNDHKNHRDQNENADQNQNANQNRAPGRRAEAVAVAGAGRTDWKVFAQRRAERDSHRRQGRQPGCARPRPARWCMPGTDCAATAI